MNREILFRGLRSDGGGWVEGFYFIDLENKKPYIMLKERKETIEDWMIKSIEVIPETVGQFTGLIDKNGVKMFEDDCVKMTFMKDERYNRLTFYNNELPDYLISVIKYNERRCHFQLEFEENNPHKIVSCEIGWYKENFEVIGNINDKK